ncbi:MAG TPA: lytic transglycosylase domain-containing protein [Bryobacteraceae bacterium]|jgi:soluble lytic murein transglycosylase-like protein|nr:lytic transglycosylase domain-containing protein [Bryobacteraceae bacterium]
MANFTTVPAGQVPQLIANAAGQYGVPPTIAMEVALTESSLNQTAVSPAGAVGIMQLMPATAAGLGVNPYDTTQNINGGMQYLAGLFAQFGSWDQALGAYNWGPGNVQNAVSNYGSSWLSYAPAETQNYVSSILASSGQSYTAALTPASVTAGAQNTVSSAIDSLSGIMQSVTPGTLVILAALALGTYFLSEIVFD